MELKELIRGLMVIEDKTIAVCELGMDFPLEITHPRRTFCFSELSSVQEVLDAALASSTGRQDMPVLCVRKLASETEMKFALNCVATAEKKAAQIETLDKRIKDKMAKVEKVKKAEKKAEEKVKEAIAKSKK